MAADKQTGRRGKTEEQSREERLAKALRDNLKRRKAQPATPIKPEKP